MGRAGRGGGGGSRGGSFGGSRGFSSHSGGSSHRSSFGSCYHSSSSSRHSYHHSSSRSSFSSGYVLGSIVSGSNPRRRSVSSTSSSDKTGLIIFAIVLVLYIIGDFLPAITKSGSSDSIQKSTVEREKLESSSIVETDSYYIDSLGWISDRQELEEGMEYFYEKTGVQPFLIITDEIDGSHSFDEYEVEDYANEVYEELFDDEAHLLVIFYEYNEVYHSYCLTGTEAKTVIDDEAREIVLDYIDHYYYSDYDEDTMFSKVFTESADRIMTVTPHYGWIVAIILLVIVVLCLLLSWWTKKKRAKLAEMNKAQQILDQDLNSFGASSETSNATATTYTPPPAANVYDSKEVDELKKKYDNM
ncbi:MAG: TPM domain-containing protein [Ruminococcus sp.]|nr:TPM domain-containing protein [Ruminococcus sp.]